MSGPSKLGQFNLTVIKDYKGSGNQHSSVFRPGIKHIDLFYLEAGYYFVLGPAQLYVLVHVPWNIMCTDIFNKYRARTYHLKT